MKTYQIEQERKGRTKLVKGTLAELISYFSYTLEVGASWNRKINRNPKTIKSFLSNLRKSFDEKEGGYERTSIRLITN